MMRHCRQCRADAIGLLDKDRSGEFVRTGSCGSGCGPVNAAATATAGAPRNDIRIAAATDDGIEVNGGFGNTPSFRMYVVNNEKITEDGIVKITKRTGGVYGDAHTENISTRITSLKDADIIIVKEIGPRPLSDLRNSGRYVHITKGNVKDSIHEAVRGYLSEKQ